MNVKQPKINYEKQDFDNLGINPYEVVIALARKAREINDKALKYLGAEDEINPINIALEKLNNKNIKFVYGNDEKKGISEELSQKE